MPRLNDIPAPGRQQKNCRERLEAQERECAELESMGDVPHLDFDFVDPRTGHLVHDSFSCPWCELRERATAYRSVARARTCQRPIPRLPAGTAPDVRAIVQSSIDAAEEARGVFHGLLHPQSGATRREIIDGMAECKYRERVKSAHIAEFNKRIEVEWDWKYTAQGRAFNWQTIDAARKRGVKVSYPNRHQREYVS
jgi:hypothetical protein